MGRAYFIPAPTGGWNTRDPLLLMPETDAQDLVNVVCETGYVRSLGGENSSAFADLGVGATDPVATLQNLRLESGSEVFLAIGVSSKFWNITAGGSGTNISATYDATAAMTDPYWQTCVYRHRIFGCNGADRPFVWTGSGDVQLAAWTGPASNATKLVGVQPYKSRLYFVEKENASYWYTTAVDNVTGALIEVPMDSLLHLGGTLAFAGSSSNRLGQGSQELFVIYSTEGEVLIYQGRYPGDASWSIVGRYQIARPLNYRPHVYVDTKLYLISQYGPVGVHELLSGVDPNDAFQIESGKVRQAFLKKTSGVAFNARKNWGGIHFKGKNYTVFNVATDASHTEQFVVNTITNAWFRWDVFDLVHSMAVFNGKLYLGDYTGGEVNEVDQGESDEWGQQRRGWDMRHAANFLGNPKAAKKVTLFKPIFATHGKTSDDNVHDTSELTFSLEADLSYSFGEELEINALPTNIPYDYDADPLLNKRTVSVLVDGLSFMAHLTMGTPNIETRYYGSWLQVEDAGGLA